MRTITFILFLFLICCSFGQVPFVSPYKFSEDILLEITYSDPGHLAWDLSYIGEYEQTLKMWDNAEQAAPWLDTALKNHFKKFKPVIAKEFIIQKAKTEQIIIINEAHHQPYHRAFTISILEDLYKQGFRYFGAETLSEHDMDRLNFKKYPIMLTGYYTCEPMYANLIREALRIGFKVFAYETNRLESDSAGVNMREVDQAKNIKKILEKDPKAKIFIHCGFGHIIETPVYSWGMAMAGRLKEYTGIDPYTIDQIKLTESSTDEFTNSYFHIINSTDYLFFVDATGKAFDGPPGIFDYDARVYHPKTRWVDGRPHWMFEGDRLGYFPNKKITINYPCLVFAYAEGEDIENENPAERAIPFDVIELKNQEDNKALSLKKGNYTIVVKSKNGEEQKFNLNFK